MYTVNSSHQHYASHLAAYYRWSVGGAEAAILRAERELAELGLVSPATVADLGSGFGAHAMALARGGSQVTAVDDSKQLLAELRALANSLPIYPVECDIVEWVEQSPDTFDAVLCMGDTLTHLPSIAHAEKLVQAAGQRVRPRGSLLLTFRDYTRQPPGSDLSVVVRSEAERIATCVVEYQTERVLVRDLLHELVEGEWRVASSRYEKLALAPEQVACWLETSGYRVVQRRTASGMAALLATRREANVGVEDGG